MYTCIHFLCYSGWQPIFVFIILINFPSTYHVCWWKPGVSPGFFTTRALTIWRSNLLGLKRFCGLRAWHGRGAPGSTRGWCPKSGIGLYMIQWVSRIQFYTILTQPKISKDHQNQGFIAQTTNNKGFAAKFRIQLSKSWRPKWVCKHQELQIHWCSHHHKRDCWT